jgi:uncharacterized membrane protein HdeD (DUF308 family)
MLVEDVSEERNEIMADVAQPQPMLSSVAGRAWWTLVLRGVVAVLFGLAALFWPGKTLFVLILFFGAYTLVDGIFAIVGGIMDSSRRWLLLIEGVLGVVAGLILLARPDLGALVLLYVIAIWAIVTGVMEVLAAISLRREIDNEWLMILGGALSVIFGVILAVLPGAGLLSLTWLIGAFAIIFGVAFIVFGFRVRGLGGSSRVT